MYTRLMLKDNVNNFYFILLLSLSLTLVLKHTIASYKIKINKNYTKMKINMSLI